MLQTLTLDYRLSDAYTCLVRIVWWINSLIHWVFVVVWQNQLWMIKNYARFIDNFLSILPFLLYFYVELADELTGIILSIVCPLVILKLKPKVWNGRWQKKEKVIDFEVQNQGHSTKSFMPCLMTFISCLHWEMKGHGSHVNFVKWTALLKDLLATRVLSFPDANEKVYFSPFIYANFKSDKLPLKKWKIQCQFFFHMTSGIHWKIFATVFLCLIAGEYHGSVNISICSHIHSWERSHLPLIPHH